MRNCTRNQEIPEH
uniref:Uncharacterized protein n=1 Tax=Lepeophtheirus salmonis TaxID=72036 RepID=A0A0K2TF68_LEPSM